MSKGTGDGQSPMRQDVQAYRTPIRVARRHALEKQIERLESFDKNPGRLVLIKQLKGNLEDV